MKTIANILKTLSMVESFDYHDKQYSIDFYEDYECMGKSLVEINDTKIRLADFAALVGGVEGGDTKSVHILDAIETCARGV